MAIAKSAESTLRVLLGSLLVISAACSDSPRDAAVVDGEKDSGAQASPDAGDDEADATQPADAGEPDCYERPTTHLEIINACTDAEFLDKTPVLPLLEANGALPPIP